MLGDLHFKRAYYHCKHCHTGCLPPDAEFGLKQKLTPGAREVVALVGVLQPFEEDAQTILPRLCGLAVSASTVQRVTEAVGDDVAQRRASGETFGPCEPWNWHRDATGNRTAYVSLDATGVRQQTATAEKAEARMPWVAAVFNPQPPDPQNRRKRQRMWDARYISGLMSLPEIGTQLRRECQAVGIEQADVVIAISDGGNGLEGCLIDTLAGLAKRIEVILDFYHVQEHVTEFAKLWIPAEEPRKAQVTAWCHLLKHQGGEALLSELTKLDLAGTSDAVVEGHRLLTGYLRHNLHRTDYPRYRKNGWQIGSGAIESACKTVVAQRLKQSGMRWREYGTTALCQLRALYKSQRQCWRNYWTGNTTA